eukprot:Plantae.Rhodophyta-Purpureofilum_apyrenoidigerum.ctg19855.p1 GENE.Plantae.Rhodophyta-Purpureofilum_apyrenoidigerum.ctg19855~~Plantae.Rhodophyta-Purpureofilum_apyrenoidigerum.ctg19855.p1  ORF type:complete len:324 (-),score=25.25 Plantae.Rhodophyta-Purpureofilum_apyrenoidigerum.ctg19855:87-947(-)
MIVGLVVRVLWTLGGFVLCCIAGFGALSFSQIRRAEAPYAALRSFAERHDVQNPLEAVGDLRVDQMKLFAQATCVQGPGLEIVRRALRKQLRGVPDSVVEAIVDSALIEGVSAQNSVQNTTAGIENDGRAYSYLAFWSTEYNGDHTVIAAAYSTCVMVSGVEILVGEDVAEWETSVQPRLVGHQPCHCGFLSCAQCPIYQESTTKRPIMKRHRLTLQNQLDLHRWMVKSAVDQARYLVETREGTIGNAKRLTTSSDYNYATLGWSPPDTYTFHGGKQPAEDNHNEL